MIEVRTSAEPGFWWGALIGALLTTMLGTVLFLGQQLAGLPFPPFYAFDWTARRLPGARLTAGIDSLVSAITTLGVGPTAEVAKRVEQTMAIAGFVLAGAVLSGLFFVLLRRRAVRRVGVAGLTVGALAGAVLLGI